MIVAIVFVVNALLCFLPLLLFGDSMADMTRCAIAVAGIICTVIAMEIAIFGQKIASLFVAEVTENVSAAVQSSEEVMTVVHRKKDFYDVLDEGGRIVCTFSHPDNIWSWFNSLEYPVYIEFIDESMRADK